MTKLIWALLVVAKESHYTLLLKSQLLLSILACLNPNWIPQFLPFKHREIPQFVTHCVGENQLSSSFVWLKFHEIIHFRDLKSHLFTIFWEKIPWRHPLHLLDGSWYKASRVGHEGSEWNHIYLLTMCSILLNHSYIYMVYIYIHMEYVYIYIYKWNMYLYGIYIYIYGTWKCIYIYTYTEYIYIYIYIYAETSCMIYGWWFRANVPLG